MQNSNRAIPTLFALLIATMLAACAPGYTRSTGPNDLDATAVLLDPDRSGIRISYDPQFARGAVTAASLGIMTMEYIVDDHLAGSHTIYEAYDRVFHLKPGDHEIVLQRCYRGLLTLGGRDCRYIKYAFSLPPRNSGTLRVIEPNVFRPEHEGFLQWYELESKIR